MNRARKFLTEIMAETIIFGGCSATREEVYEDCIERGLPRLGYGAEWFAMRPPAVDPASVTHLPTLADIREYEERQEQSMIRRSISASLSEAYQGLPRTAGRSCGLRL